MNEDLAPVKYKTNKKTKKPTGKIPLPYLGVVYVAGIGLVLLKKVPPKIIGRYLPNNTILKYLIVPTISYLSVIKT